MYVILAIIGFLIPAETIRTGFASVVRISDTITDKVGTGVIVGTRHGFTYVLTAAHLIGRNSAPTMETFKKSATDKSFENGDVQYHDADADLAIVRFLTNKHTYAPIIIAPKATVLLGGWAIGCDDGDKPQLLAVAAIRARWVRQKNDVITLFWESKGEITSGRSGGPLLDGQGRLVGICSGTQEKKSYYSHLDEIYLVLSRSRFNWILEKADRQ